MFRRVLCIAVPVAMFCARAGAQSNWVIWSQPQNTTYAIVPSYVSSNPAADIEVADDFEVTGTVERIVVSGYDCFNCAPPEVAGARVRFYAWTPSGPGELQSEIFIPDGDPHLQYSPIYPAGVDITLPSPFAATGKHFVAVQLAFDGAGEWDWWITNHNSAQGVAAMTRDNSGGGEWEPLSSVLGPLNSDVTFMLWGNDGNPPPPGTDPCGQWSVVSTPNPAATDHAILRDVVAVAADDVWAVGEYTSVVQGSYLALSMALHWDGTAWAIMPSPNPTACPSCTYVTFDAVAATDSGEIWAGGGKRVQSPDGFMGTHLFVARYDGSSWTVMNTPLTVGGSGANVRDIEVVSADDIWFFGDWIDTSGGPGNSQPALAMHWNGSNFTVLPTPNPSFGTPGWATEAGSALSSSDIWAVGGGSDGDYAAASYIIHWDGSEWTHVPGPAPGTYHRLYDVHAIAPDDVWAVGDYFQAGSGYFPLFLHWDGSSWTQVPSPGGGRSLVAFSSDNVYSGGAGIVHWDGVSWQLVEQFNSVIGPSIAAIAAPGLCDMWAVGRQIVVGNILNFSAHLQSGQIGSFSSIGDLNGDGTVAANDLALLLGSWGACDGCSADLDHDGVVNAGDLALLLGNWG